MWRLHGVWGGTFMGHVSADPGRAARAYAAAPAGAVCACTLRPAPDETALLSAPIANDEIPNWPSVVIVCLPRADVWFCAPKCFASMEVRVKECFAEVGWGVAACAQLGGLASRACGLSGAQTDWKAHGGYACANL